MFGYKAENGDRSRRFGVTLEVRWPPSLLRFSASYTPTRPGATGPDARELCDLYGRAGFDVLAITDHTCERHRASRDELLRRVSRRDRAEAERARAPLRPARHPRPRADGRERRSDPRRARARARPARASSASATGSRKLCAPRARKGRRSSPPTRISPTEAGRSWRRTAAFAADPARWAPLLDRFELFNRDTLFPWVAAAELPGDRLRRLPPCSSTSRPGRRCCRARRMSRRCSTTSARRGRRSSPVSSASPLSSRPPSCRYRTHAPFAESPQRLRRAPSRLDGLVSLRPRPARPGTRRARRVREPALRRGAESRVAPAPRSGRSSSLTRARHRGRLSAVKPATLPLPWRARRIWQASRPRPHSSASVPRRARPAAARPRTTSSPRIGGRPTPRRCPGSAAAG